MNDKTSQLQQLRQRAEIAMKTMSGQLDIQFETVEELIHELDVYRTELEMQYEDLKQAHDKLEIAQQHYTDLFDFAPVSFVVINSQGKIVNINKTATVLLGLKPTDGRDLPFQELISPEHRDIYHIHKQSVLRTGNVQECEVKIYGANKAIFYARLMTEKLDDNTFHTAIIDISASKQTQQILERTLEQEKQLNQLRNRVLSVIAHEFRTPLATILSSTETLERYGNRLTDEKKQKRYQTIQNLVWYLNDVVQEASLSQHLDDNVPHLKPETFDISLYARQVIDDMSGIAGQQRIVLDVDTQDNTSQVRCDRHLLRRILMNILGNALKYSDSPVSCRVDIQDAMLLLRIKDEGIGIAQKDLPHIYEPFYRGESASFIPGSGIGLYVVEQAVKAYKGTIRCDSTEGEGTTFTISLPLYDGNSAQKT